MGTKFTLIFFLGMAIILGLCVLLERINRKLGMSDDNGTWDRPRTEEEKKELDRFDSLFSHKKGELKGRK